MLSIFYNMIVDVGYFCTKDSNLQTTIKIVKKTAIYLQIQTYSITFVM